MITLSGSILSISCFRNFALSGLFGMVLRKSALHQLEMARFDVFDVNVAEVTVPHWLKVGHHFQKFVFTLDVEVGDLYCAAPVLLKFFLYIFATTSWIRMFNFFLLLSL